MDGDDNVADVEELWERIDEDEDSSFFCSLGRLLLLRISAAAERLLLEAMNFSFSMLLFEFVKTMLQRSASLIGFLRELTVRKKESRRKQGRTSNDNTTRRREAQRQGKESTDELPVQFPSLDEATQNGRQILKEAKARI